MGNTLHRHRGELGMKWMLTRSINRSIGANGDYYANPTVWRGMRLRFAKLF